MSDAVTEIYQGVVCSLKENFGFIERSDVVKEIFFHYSEFQGDIDALNLGDDVEFGIQTRNVSLCISLIKTVYGLKLNQEYLEISCRRTRILVALRRFICCGVCYLITTIH